MNTKTLVIRPQGPAAWLFYIRDDKLMAHVVDYGTGKEIGYLLSSPYHETSVVHYDHKGQEELITLSVKDMSGSTLDLLLNKNEFKGFLDRNIEEPTWIPLNDPRFGDYSSFMAKMLAVDISTYKLRKVDHIFVTNRLITDIQNGIAKENTLLPRHKLRIQSSKPAKNQPAIKHRP